MFRRLVLLGSLLLSACGEETPSPVTPTPPKTPTTPTPPTPTGKGTVTGTLSPLLTSSSLVRDARWDVSARPELRRRVAEAASRVLAARRQTWSASVSAPAPAVESVPGDVIVRFDEANLSADEALARVRLPGYRAVHKGFLSEHAQLIGYESEAPQALRRDETDVLPGRLVGRVGVRSAEKNVRFRALRTPTDPDYARQWHYPAMNLPAAWDVTQGLDSVAIGVVDSGIVSHPDLSKRVVAGADVILDAASAGDGDGRDTDPTDLGGDMPQGGSSWHGTHVAGTIGASTNDGYGVAGVTWAGRIVPVRALGSDGGSLSDVAVGIQWAAGLDVAGLPKNQNPAKVINLSLGGPSEPSATLQDVIDKVSNAGVIVVVAAGNDNVEAASFSPCNQQRVICVGATRLDGKRASYSNYGSAVDVMAAGGDSQDLDGNEEQDGVLSTLLDSGKKAVSGYHQGTSMASPHVAGIVALMKAVKPALTVTEAESILKETADKTSQCAEGCGAGLVNAQAAVLRAQGTLNTSAAPKLALGTPRIAFGNSGTWPLSVRNVGGGTLKVTAKESGTGIPSLSFDSGNTVTVPAYSAALLPVTLAASGQSDGNHTTQLTLTGDNGQSATVQVKYRVGYLKDQDVLLVFFYVDDSGELTFDEEEGIGLVTAAKAYSYRAQLTPRRYVAYAAIDDDNDGTLEQGEREGYWRDATNIEPLEVRAGQTLSGVDFALVPSQP